MSSLSIIIPAFNAEKTIKAVLQPICSSLQPEDEVIIVNDASVDQTVCLASEFKCIIRTLISNQGAACARNRGAEWAQNDLLLFIDADVIVKPEQIEAVRNFFSTNPDVQTITANLSNEKSDLNFYSDYKNLYMNFIINGCQDQVNFVYGAFCAIRKVDFIPWPEDIRLTEDSLWGHKQSLLGYNIRCLKNLEVKHLKHYDFFSLLKNDFEIAAFFAKSFLEFNRWNTLFTKEKFGHTSKKQMICVLLATAGASMVLLSPKLFLPFLCSWIALNSSFFNAIYKKRSLLFTIHSIVWTYLDHLIYFLGITYGVITSLAPKSGLQTEKLPS